MWRRSSPDAPERLYQLIPHQSGCNLVALADGSNPIRLTNNPAGNLDPSWSPDGARIAFASYRDAQQEIYVMNANGSNQIRLTNTPGGNFEPAWSPDGGKIAFTSTRNGSNNPNIYMMDANGLNQTNLTNYLGEDRSPAWSPDGTKIAFSRASRICVISAYGGNATQLTIGGDEPAWSPDGTKIAFTGSVAGNSQIFVMNADGSNQTNITNDSNTRFSPAWQRIAAAPTPTPAAQAINLSTRMRVQTGNNVGIGGFIITGSVPKHVLLRAIGPSLNQFGVPDALADPVLELHGPDGFVTVTNDNWRDDPAQATAIVASGIPPTNDLESAIDATLTPGSYTAVVSGKNNSSGVALVEVYDLNARDPSKLGNISTRAFVSTGNNIVIAGFILGDNAGNDRVIVRGMGPSLTAQGIANALANPTLELRDSNGTLLVFNNDWQDNPAQAAQINAAGLGPANQLESGIAATLPPGLYTALLAGQTDTDIGLGLVEVYDLGSP